MDKLKKVGLTALGTALVSTSAIAADVAVGGGAALTFNGGDNSTEGNGWSMLDSLTFRASADLDNGWSVSTAQNLGKGTINNSNMKVNWLPIENVLPESPAPPLVCSTFKLAPPDTLIAPAKAEVATSEPARAVKPIFLMFILITPFI